jgi:hypothetical protein
MTKLVKINKILCKKGKIVRTHVHTHIPVQRTKTGETDVLYIYYCLTKKL